MKKLLFLFGIIAVLGSCQKENLSCDCFLESVLVEEYSLNGDLLCSQIPDVVNSYPACDYDNSDKIVSSLKHDKGYTITTLVKKCY